MSLLNGTRPSAAEAPKEAAVQLETLLVKQLLTSSGAFKGGSAAGSSLVQGLFADTLAEAVAKSGELGIAGPMERELRAKVPTPAPTVAAPAAAAPAMASPLADPTAHITSRFGMRTDPIDGTKRNHSGVDIAAHTGTPILAAGDGVVVRAGSRGGYGQAVEIQHGSGVSTLYAHAAQLLVHPGEHVTQGQTIATVGQTGRATGPHLHFEVRSSGRALNPTRALSAYGQRAENLGENSPK